MQKLTTENSPLAAHQVGHPTSRRQAFRRLGALLSVPSWLPRLGVVSLAASRLGAANFGPLTPEERREQAFVIRNKAALQHRDVPLAQHAVNGDDLLYPSWIHCFAKGLPHNEAGEVDRSAYSAYLRALASGRMADLETVPMGGTAKLANPCSAYAYQMEGTDGHQLDVAAPPAFSSAEQAADMAEVYWLALTRDIPFARYEDTPLIGMAAEDLTKLAEFGAPRENGRITARTVFRGSTPGDLTGPYISQFLWKPVPYGSMTITQRYRTTVAGADYLTSFDEWLAVQRGQAAPRPARYDDTTRYLRNGRDLALWLHKDFTYQGFLNAALILIGLGGAVASRQNPYATSQAQAGFVTYGGPQALDFVTRVANAALKATWCQKWLVHRRLRPEEFGGRVHHNAIQGVNYPIHSDMFQSSVLPMVQQQYGTHLLPMAYPEGCPLHPSYPAGHAAIAGACVTVLKALFREEAVLADPVVASDDGLTLEPYRGPDLTVRGELDKLAANISLGRDTAGVHYRSDGIAGMLLGEEVAIKVLQDLLHTLPEQGAQFEFTSFRGEPVHISHG